MRSSTGGANGITPPQSARPSLAPGIYFRALLVGYFAEIDSERGIA